MGRRGSIGDTYGAGSASIIDMISRIRSAPQMVAASLPVLGGAILAQLQATAAAGQAPDGAAWAPKKTGGRAMVNAAAALSMSVVGKVILVKLTGPEVFHHFGVGGKGRVARRILPTGGLPDRLGNAIRKGQVAFCEAWMGRAGRHDRGSGGVRMLAASATAKGSA